jgi:hypothetical protein
MLNQAYVRMGVSHLKRFLQRGMASVWSPSGLSTPKAECSEAYHRDLAKPKDCIDTCDSRWRSKRLEPVIGLLKHPLSPRLRAIAEALLNVDGQAKGF